MASTQVRNRALVCQESNKKLELDSAHAEAAKEPQRYEDEHNDAKNTAQSPTAIAPVSVVTATAAENKH
jgi:hypothetical protein